MTNENICVILYLVKPDAIASRGGYYGLINIEIINGKMHVVSKYNQRLVSFMRQQPGKFWDANKREWVIPESSMPGLLNLIDDLGEEYNIVNKDESTKVHVPIPENYVFKTEPYKHQIEGVEYGLDHPKFLLADEQGCIDGDSLIEYCLIGETPICCKLSDFYSIFTKSQDNSRFRVRCYDGTVTRFHGISNVLYSGEKEVFKITLENGMSVNATHDHPILTDFGFIAVDRLLDLDGIRVRIGSDYCSKSFSVKSVDSVGIRPTYDIVMLDPYRNFIANGIVVHNCGKTKQVIDLASIYKQNNGFKHVLVIACVNGLKYNWRKEVAVHSDETGYILGTRYTKKGREYIGSNQDRLDDLKSLGTGADIDKSFFIITNIETLRYSKSVQVPMKRKKNGEIKYKKQTVFPIVEEINRQIESGNIQMVIADELHRCKDPSAIQSKSMLSISCDHLIALTGTPIMNRPEDAYTPLAWLGYIDYSFYKFKGYFCLMGGYGAHQIVGYQHLEDLQAVLDKCMLRRLKSEVLDLPEKVYINDYVEMTPKQIKLYEDVTADITDNIDKIELIPNPLTMLIRLRQVTGNPNILSSDVTSNPKYDRMLEILEDVVANGKKALVYSNWTDVLIPAYELAKKKGYRPALYTGQNVKEREAEIKTFKTDPNCKVLFGTIGAMGTGLTLTEATTVIFLDEPWNRAIKDQCEDRVHRIGTSESPNIITLMCRGTIDERINDIVYRKGKLSDIIIDKEQDIMSNKQLLNYLLSTN